MASTIHSLSSPDISDVMSLLYMMKKQNDEILARNEEILAKQNSIEEDNHKLRRELLEIKSSLKRIVKVSSRKRDGPEDEAEHQNEHSNNKKARVSVTVASLPPETEHEHEPESGHILESPSSFNTLDDDCLGNVLDFVGKKCYSTFGRVNKRCHEMFCSKGLPKETYLFGYGPLHLIRRNHAACRDGVLHYNRRDILDWMFTDENYDGYMRLKWLCCHAIIESSARLYILREVFRRANEQQLEHIRDCNSGFNLCRTAADCGNLECLRFLRENECEWNQFTWSAAKEKGHEHILEYLRNNGYPTEWRVESDS